MFITVEDAVKLPSFRSANIIAGAEGMNRRIYRVNVVECPEFPVDVSLVGRNNLLFMDGDFLITSFYAIKNRPQDILKTIKLYNQFNSSGICIAKKYIKEIPQEVIDYADENKYPILAINSQIDYANMISDIMKSIYGRYNQEAVNELIDKIISGHFEEEEIKRMAYSLFSGFKNNIMVFCIRLLENENANHVDYIVHKINSNQSFNCLKYYNRLIIFSSLSNEFKDSFIENLKNDIMEIISISKMDYCMGVSKRDNELHTIGKAIENSITACDTCSILGEKIIEYENIGIYKLLMKVKDKTFLMELYESLIAPIVEYDKNNNGSLFETLICFVKSDGDIKKTAIELYQHCNTIRYRIAKIRALLNVEDKDLKFYEDLNLIYKLYYMFRSSTL